MPTPRSFLSSLLLSTSLLVGACTHATRTTADAGTTGPIRAKQVQPAGTARGEIDRALLRDKLAERRAATVSAFLAYRDAGVYPINTFKPGLAHVWLDELGHLCAAATVISSDWGFAATAAVSNEDNFIQLADVKDGPLAEWMLTSGLAVHELVAIQEPMEGGGMARMRPPTIEMDPQEQQRLYNIYVSVERQIQQLWDESLDEAVDALAAHPDLARRFLRGELPGPGKYAA